jgi:succinate dehydrogenase/fumarate reductase cytochrome b subunit
MTMPQILSRGQLRDLHRLSAFLLLAFLLLHLGNHIAGVAGQATHTAVLQNLRPSYRNIVVEPILITLFFWQAISGLWLAWVRRRARGWAGLQALSGAYLALFLLIHISAVIAARALNGTDTDLAFAAAGLHAGGIWPWLFAPYYGLAVAALFAHLAVPLRRRFGPPAAIASLATGISLSIVLVLLLAGLIVPLSIPAPLIAAYP